MKKSIKMIAAGFIICACLVGGVAGILMNTSKEEEKLEQRVLQDTSSLVRASEKSDEAATEQESLVKTPETVTVSAKSQDASRVSKQNITVSDEKIVFTNGSEEGFVISRKEAVEKAIQKAAEERLIENVSELQSQTFTLSALNTTSGKFYVGYANLSQEKRYCFEVNALTGNVSESDMYVLEAKNGMVWFKASTDSKSVERIIQEDNLDAFDAINLDLQNVVDCEIVKGDHYSVSAHFYGDNHDYTLECKVENKTLKITSDIKTQHSKDNINERISILTITVPKNVCLNRVYTDNLVGDVMFRGIESKDTKITSISGDIDIKDSSLEALEAKVTSGDIILDQWSKGSLDLATISGDVIVDQISGGKVGLSTTSGDIHVKNTKDCQLSMGLSSGEIEVEKIESGSVKVASSCADITIGAIAAGSLQISNISGEIEVNGVGTSGTIRIDVATTSSPVNITCNGKKTQYSYKIESDYGENTVGSQTSDKTISQSNSSGNEIYVKNQSEDNCLTFSN